MNLNPEAFSEACVRHLVSFHIFKAGVKVASANPLDSFHADYRLESEKDGPC